MSNRRDLFKFTASNAFAWFAVERLPNSTRAAAKESFGDLQVYFDGPTEQLSAITGKPDRGRFIDGKVTKMANGSMMFCAANTLHGIVNPGK